MIIRIISALFALYIGAYNGNHVTNRLSYSSLCAMSIALQNKEVSDENEKIFSSTITIENKTPIDLYFALYYSNVTSTQIQPRQFLPAGAQIQVVRPARLWGYDRQVYFSINKEVLTPFLSRKATKLVPNFNIGSIADSFSIVFNDGIFQGYNSFDTALQPLLQGIENTYQQFTDTMLQPLRQQYENPNKDKTAEVRISCDISLQEQEYLQKRTRFIKNNIEQLLGHTVTENTIPRIAVCCSGGGYRAMISTLGSMIALEKIGILNCITYVSGLSGSTWLMAPWMMMGIPFSEYRAQLGARINNGLTQDLSHVKIADILWKKFVFEEPLSAIDIYGALLGHQLLEKKYRKESLTAQEHCLEDGSCPCPIYTAITSEDPYEWIEFTPYEIGSEYLGGFIPSWSLGCDFTNGKTTNIIPELTISFLMGIWGSAFSANIHELYEAYHEKIHSPILRCALEAGASYECFGNIRILPAKVSNPYHGLFASPYSQQDTLTLVDAGLDFNIPVPPLLRKERGLDIIIILDNSQIIKGSPALHGAERYAVTKNLPFPPISYQECDKKICSVFKDSHNPNSPVIIYLPLIKNNNYSKNFDPVTCIETSYCTTDNFAYAMKEVMELSGLTESSMIESAPLILHEIKECIERKKNK